MEYLRAAKEACGRDGTVEAFKAAIAATIAACYGLGPDAWPMFAMLAFLAGNIPVLEHILGEDMFSWPAKLAQMNEKLSSDDERRMHEYKAKVENILRERISGIAHNSHLYQGTVRANLIAVLNAHPTWRTFAAAKATECCNLQMLQDVFSCD